VQAAPGPKYKATSATAYGAGLHGAPSAIASSGAIAVAMSAMGPKADIEAPSPDVRFTPKSGHREGVLGCLLRAISRHRPSLFDHFVGDGEHCEPGIFTPNAFAPLAGEIAFEPMLWSAASTATG
jgi:hypothetical protein